MTLMTRQRPDSLMRDVHHLYPEAMYRFNALFHDVWNRHDLGRLPGQSEEEVYVIPVFFRKDSRTFSWIRAESDMWDCNEPACDQEIRKLLANIRHWNADDCGPELVARMANRGVAFTGPQRRAAWEQFLEDHPNWGVYKHAKETIQSLLLDATSVHCQPEDLHRAILALYSGYPQSIERNIEGVFYRFLRHCKKEPAERPPYLEGLLSAGTASTTFEWLEVKNHCKNCPERTCIKERQYLHGPKSDTSCVERQCSEKQFIAEELFLDRLLLQTDREGSFGSALRERPEIAVIPLHDLQIAESGYGGIRALFIVFFKEPQDREVWLKREGKFPQFHKSFAELTGGLATSATVLASSSPIRPPYDLLSHFLEALTYLQDWESATVFDGGRALYQYKRTKQGYETSFKYGWIRQSTASDVSMPDSPTECIEDVEDKSFIWWTDGSGGTPNLWRDDFLPGIDSEETNRFQRFSIRFEFPEATHLPGRDDTAKRRQLRDAYIQQQLDLMRVLIPKIRARRAALRSAVSAIMGRNMSHNIGSHVLARYSSEVHEDRRETLQDKSDHRRDFLSYLQRRMDFLAEVATSDQSYWEQPLSLIEALTKLNYNKQSERMGTYSKCQVKGAACPTNLGKPGVPILLSFITGKGNKATVLLGTPGTAETIDAADATESASAPSDVFFSCPSGDVGVHALYVILENIVRNSARHGSSTVGDVGLYVFFDIRNADQLIEVTIVDPRTHVIKYAKNIDAEGYALHEDGSRMSATKPDVDSEGYVLNTDGMRCADGTRILCHHINHIINQQSLLTQEGDTNSQYWGLREMHICAHYLRGLSFRDLEGGMVDGAPAVLRALEYPLTDGNQCLSYKILLKPAKRLAYAVDARASANEHLQPEKLFPLGIKPIIVAEYIDWHRVAAEARGFEFLALAPEHRDAYQHLNRATPDPTVANAGLLPVRVVFLKGEELERLKEKAMAANPEWTNTLHAHVLEYYRRGSPEKARQWSGNIEVYAAWDGQGTLPIQVRNGLTCNHVQRGGGYRKPFAEDTRMPWQADQAVGIAWVDHADDALMNPVIWSTDTQCYMPTASKLQSSYLPMNSTGDYPNWVSAEPVFAQSVHHGVLKKARDENSLEGIEELVAAAFARVVVLDERVQDCRTKKVRNATLFKCWPQAGIWCPLRKEDFPREGFDFDSAIKASDAFHERDVCSDLNRPDFDKIHSFLCRPTKLTYQCPADFLVIHLTILESLNKHRQDRQETLNDTLRALVKGTSCEKAEIIIVTGRGVPAGQVHLACRYLPISALLDYLVMHPSKLGLMRVLWAATARTHPG